MDLVRRRRWHCKMVADSPQAPCFFQLRNQEVITPFVLALDIPLKPWKIIFTFFSQGKIREFEKKCYKSGGNQGILLAQERQWPVCCRFILKYFVQGEERMAVRGEEKSSHVCVIVHTGVHTVHTGVLGFAMFTSTTVLCNSIKFCLKPEISLKISWNVENLSV